MQKLLLTLAIVGVNIFLTTAQKCGECQTSNLVYCVNQTYYYNCMDNVKFGAIESCNEGEVCSNTDLVCEKTADVDGSTIQDVCGGPSGNGADCKTCAKANKFTCISGTQYTRCVSGNPSTTVYNCDPDEVCLLDGLTLFKKICVPSCVLSYLNFEPTCSNEVDVTTTTVAPITTTAADYTNICQDSAQSSSTVLYFFTINTGDSTCQSYIYCQRPNVNSQFNTGIYIKCSSATPYYSSSANKCVSTKPSNC